MNKYTKLVKLYKINDFTTKEYDVEWSYIKGKKNTVRINR